MPLPFQLTESQLERIKPYFPLSHGVARIDDRRVISGIVYVIRNGLPWKDAPREYGPHKTLYNLFVRWGTRGVFNRIFAALAGKSGVTDGLVRWRTRGIFNRIFAALAGKAGMPERLMIDATHLKAHRTAASLQQKRA